MGNICCQYLVCFFMWAWLPRCLQEERNLKIDCKSRPPWGVPVFLVMGMGTDIASNAILHNMIVKCNYIKWPTDKTDAVLTRVQSGGVRKQAIESLSLREVAWSPPSPASLA